ncbi:MAG: Holliday junction branch migration protein RuvA [Candidatus Auribacterota bacterium]|jgi:Holliday junction DNA helicase RuvA|uniref:Holliday junction branch migration complex subunit RuvA n=1 Tax=Candidatus Auribacter fodinae TaxID=2093366 RepID=A0A3A4QTZ7_9BACT|nr:MAG: Holliday junction branch migration protein RuvA [Candidatus Auribacter fodinae]
MIAYVKGILHEAQPTRCVIDVHGAGVEIFIPVSTHEKLPSVGKEVRLLTYLYIREDNTSLYGFATPEEKEAFILLLSVSKIGPKGALSILSGIRVAELKTAILSNDSKRISLVPGIGVKTAERLILELKEKISHIFVSGEVSTPAGQNRVMINDAVSALLALGYPQAQAQNAVQRVIKTKSLDSFSIEDLVKLALQQSK